MTAQSQEESLAEVAAHARGVMAMTAQSQEELLAEVAAHARGVRAEERNVSVAVGLARQGGCSWSKIGAALGVTKESAWKRFRYIDTSL